MKKTRIISRLLRILRTSGLIIAAILSLLTVNALVLLALYWFAGILGGFNVYDRQFTNSQEAQLLLIGQTIDFVLVFQLRKRWLKTRRLAYWRFMKKASFVLLGIIILVDLGGSSFFFLHGQRGGDYGCGQEISLSRAYNATYPITAGDSGGTAFAIDNHGTMVTAYHVIAGAKTIILDDATKNGTKLSVIRINKAYDVAILHYDQPTPDFIPLTSTYQVADQVYEIGWPENVDQAGQGTITSGIISREISSSDAHESGDNVPNHLSYIQTDAATNPGNSGGPLLDTCGAVGVINSSSTTQDGSVTTPQIGINYATSSASVKYALGLK